jgi:hypothetical protein
MSELQSTSLAGYKAIFYNSYTSHTRKKEYDGRERGYLCSAFNGGVLIALGRGQYGGCF